MKKKSPRIRKNINSSTKYKDVLTRLLTLNPNFWYSLNAIKHNSDPGDSIWNSIYVAKMLTNMLLSIILVVSEDYLSGIYIYIYNLHSRPEYIYIYILTNAWTILSVRRMFGGKNTQFKFETGYMINVIEMQNGSCFFGRPVESLFQLTWSYIWTRGRFIAPLGKFYIFPLCMLCIFLVVV